MVATTQPLATESGLRILQQGGNAADAAVAVAAALSVTEPFSTGIGGDACALFYDQRKKTVECLVGYGCSPKALCPHLVKTSGFELADLPESHGLTVTVPGAAQLWEDVLTHWGSQSLLKVLTPAIELCENGFPVETITAAHWQTANSRLQGDGSACFKTEDGQAPLAGQLMFNRDLGQTFRTVAEHGMQLGFYRGNIAEAVIEAVAEIGGVLSLEDLESHSASSIIPPVSVKYRGYTVYEVPPPSQGMVVLAALNHFEESVPDPSAVKWGSEAVVHAQIEALRLAFFDVLRSNADPNACHVPLSDIISKQHAAQQRVLYNLGQQVRHLCLTVREGFHQAAVLKSDIEGVARPDADASDTVYFCVVDAEGNACSFINSTYRAFGTGMVPKDCGFAIHNRGYNFTSQEGHPNCLGPSKRPYHTIIPGMCMNADGELYCAFGVMGGFMQPQGQLQVLSNLIDFKMDPQSALDAPRFMIQDVDSFLGPKSVEKSRVCMEPGFGESLIKSLEERGHEIINNPYCFFGHGQIITRDASGVLWGGTEPRAGGSVLSR